jgi:hypothetical protein
VNTAMGTGPVYPFDIPPAVVRKLAFVDNVIRETAHTSGSRSLIPRNDQHASQAKAACGKEKLMCRWVAYLGCR